MDFLNLSKVLAQQKESLRELFDMLVIDLIVRQQGHFQLVLQVIQIRVFELPLYQMVLHNFLDQYHPQKKKVLIYQLFHLKDLADLNRAYLL